MRPLMIQIARILNESDVYKCGFTVVGEEIYAMITDSDETVHPMLIDPAKWLDCVKGA